MPFLASDGFQLFNFYWSYFVHLPPAFCLVLSGFFRTNHETVRNLSIISCRDEVDLSSVEIFNVHNNSWRKGPDTPYALSSGRMVLSNQMEPILVGGSYDDIVYQYRLFKLKSSGWKEMDIKLKSDIFEPFAKIIPIKYLPKCK